MQNLQQTTFAGQNLRDPNRSSITGFQPLQPLDLNNNTADRPAKRRLKDGNSVQDVEQTNLLLISEGDQNRRMTTPLPESKYKVNDEPGLSTNRKNGSILKRSRIEGQRSTQELPADQESKKAKLVFREEIQEINIIENWKEYNNVETAGVSTACHCNVF